MNIASIGRGRRAVWAAAVVVAGLGVAPLANAAGGPATAPATDEPLDVFVLVPQTGGLADYGAAFTAASRWPRRS